MTHVHETDKGTADANPDPLSPTPSKLATPSASVCWGVPTTLVVNDVERFIEKYTKTGFKEIIKSANQWNYIQIQNLLMWFYFYENNIVLTFGLILIFFIYLFSNSLFIIITFRMNYLYWNIKQ